VTGSHERARQLSLAAAGPDPVVAEALDQAAIAAAARGAPDGAADLAEQAVRLTPPDHGEAMLARRLHAAEFHFAAGDSARARALLETLVREVPKGAQRAAALCRLATVRYRSDSVSIAADLLSRALEECDGNRRLRAEVERDLAWAVTLCGDVADAERHAEAALRIVDPSGDTTMLPELLAARALARFLRGHGLDVEELNRAASLERPVSRVPIEWRPRMILAMVHKWAGDVALAREHFDVLHRETIEAGDEMSLPFLLSQLSETETLAGNFRLAVDWAEAATSLAEQTGQEPIRAFALYARGLAQAHQGRIDAARDSALEGLRVAEAAGAVVAMMLNQSVLGSIDLSREEPEQADARLGPLVTWLDVVGIREPGVIRFVPDAVEALVALGQLDRADALLRPFEADGARLERGWAVLAAARVRAMYLSATGDRTRGIRHLQSAIEDHGATAGSFDMARALLVLGSALRRTRKRKAARTSLAQALERFEALGADVWAARTRTLLGTAPAEREAPHETHLTPAERRVVELVTLGSTNREAADRLFVSVRAVEVHLTNVYRKLGVRSRTELAALLTQHTAPSATTDVPST
jgi:DNA-binding CsgD family transcriptional regulator